MGVCESMFDLDNMEVSVPCPECTAENTVRIAQIKREEVVRCVACGVNIHLRDADGSVNQTTREVQDSFDELDRTLRKFGR
jgi:Zn ribbon nucleic-acid-binding protein